MERIENPKIFYKFYPVEGWLPNMLSGQSLYFSSRLNFNDPFDSRPAFILQEQDKLLRFFIKRAKQDGCTPAQSLIAAKEMVRRCKDIAYLESVQTDRKLDKFGILSLTTKWDNLLMWSHYSKFHQGICVGFHSDKDLFQDAQSVVYTSDYPHIRVPVMETITGLFETTFLNKARCWEYEDEWRVVKPLITEEQSKQVFLDLAPHMSVSEANMRADQRGSDYYQFDNSSIESITLGRNIKPDMELFVRTAVADAKLDIPIYKVNSPSTTYVLSRS